jgi:flagellar protein FlbT
LASFDDPHICATLKQVDRLVGEGHVYEALKAIRGLYPLEAQALGYIDASPQQPRPIAVGEN